MGKLLTFGLISEGLSPQDSHLPHKRKTSEVNWTLLQHGPQQPEAVIHNKRAKESTFGL